MKYLGYKVLLSLLKVLVYAKRGIFWFGSKIFAFGKYFQNIFETTIGFRLYKVQFFLKKRFGRSKNPWVIWVVDSLGSRVALQFVLFLVFLIIVYPQSAVYTDNTLGLPGRKTVLYQILGPGDQDFVEVEEVQVETIIQPENSWREGSIAYENVTAPNPNQEESGISGYGLGGTSIVKPNILPGGNIRQKPVEGETEEPQRKSFVQYTVQAGDVIGAIATRFGVSVNTILWANNLTFRSYIRPQDILKIPPGNGVLHTVKKGESLGKIARMYGVKIGEIAVQNGLRADGANLSVGTNLFIPGGSKLQPTIPVPKKVINRTEGSIGKEFEKIAAPPPSIESPAGAGYIWPTADHRITQYFGLRHTGVDIGGKVGNSNYASASGKVIKSQCGWNGGYGCYIIIDHGSGITTLYGHNSKLLVEVGEFVKQGQAIGLLGSTGHSTGPHIHFEVRVGGKRVNPLKYVR